MINPQNNEHVVRHIEIKAYVDDYQSLCTRVSALASQQLHTGAFGGSSGATHSGATHSSPGGSFDGSFDGSLDSSLDSSLAGSRVPCSNATQSSKPEPTLNAPIDRVQDDTFFNCRSGRLKLRSSGQFHDLIYYRRENDYGPSESFYQSARTKNPAALRTSLTSAFGEAGRVKKFRRTYRIGGSIIHLDRVGGLGDFIEIKVELEALDTTTSTSSKSRTASPALAPAVSVEKGARMVENLMSALDVDLFQLVDGAYVDLINERSRA